MDKPRMAMAIPVLCMPSIFRLFKMTIPPKAAANTTKANLSSQTGTAELCNISELKARIRLFIQIVPLPEVEKAGNSWCSRAMLSGGGGAVRAAGSEEDDGYTT